MALVNQPINLKEILSDIVRQASSIRRKTDILIELYISHEKTPSAISAYEPRIGILEERTKSLAKISFPDLSQLLDHAEAIGASYLNDIVIQLLHAAHGLDVLFREHYDRTLEKRVPYNDIFQRLEYRQEQLRNFIGASMNDPYPLRPENMRPTESVYFCPGAVQMMNYRDNGRIQTVKDRELTDANLSVMRRFSGGYLWWQCTACEYRVKYFIDSNNLSIHNVEEIRDHPNLAIQYRSTFLAKCHLLTESAEEERTRRRRSVFSPSTYVLKYGCIFCFSEGKALERNRTAFESARDLAEHLVEKHKSTLPPSMMLQKFCVAVKGKCAEHVRRWDVNFR